MVNGCLYPLFDGMSYEPIYKKYHVYSRHFAFIFNTFVLMQVVNFFNCRKIHDEFNILKGIFSNYIYLLILAFIVIFQWIIIYLLSAFFKIYKFHGLTVQHWLIGFLIALLGIPISMMIRCIPYGKEHHHVSDTSANELRIQEA
jgi:Ca2+-transporting ATPase